MKKVITQIQNSIVNFDEMILDRVSKKKQRTVKSF